MRKLIEAVRPKESLIGQSLEKNLTKPPKTPNFIFIQVESLNRWVMEYTFNGKSVAPFLSQLKNQSMYFENFYAVHSSGGSTDAPRVSLFGLLPHPSRRYNVKKEFDSVVDIFKSHGYQAASFHACDATSLEFDKLHEHLGIENRYNGVKSFSGEGMGTMQARDLPFFEQSFEYIREMDPQKPLFMYLITMQSHAPFRVYEDKTLEYFLGKEYKKKTLNLGGGKKKKFSWGSSSFNMNYLAAIYETDQAIELFFRKLAQSKLLDNTFVFIYSDHIGGKPHLETCLAECIPFLIYHKDLPRFSKSENSNLDFLSQLPHDEEVSKWLAYLNMRVGRYSKVSSHLDIPPTLTYIMGFKEEPFWLGSSIVSQNTKLLKGDINQQHRQSQHSQWNQSFMSSLQAKDYKIKTDSFRMEDVFKPINANRKISSESVHSQKEEAFRRFTSLSFSIDPPVYYELGVALAYGGRLITNSETHPFLIEEKKVPLFGYYKHSMRYIEPFDKK